MSADGPVPPGFVRIEVKLPAGRATTPGDLVKAAGVGLELLGGVCVGEQEATVEVRCEAGPEARRNLARLGLTRLVGWEWRWLRISLGRNHGFTLGRLKKLLAAADAGPLGRIQLNNTHTLVGLQDFRLAAVSAWLTGQRINGYPVRIEILEPGTGPGSAAYTR